MYKLFFLTIACCGLLAAGCGENRGARELLGRAQALYDSGQFAAAKNAIDSVNTLYPREIEARKKALALMRLAERGESVQTIAFCDSLAPIREAEAALLAKNFKFEKDTAYDALGRYVPPTMTIERNVERSYLRCVVDEEGVMSISSVYFGGSPVGHTGIKLSAKDGTFAETPAIPYDGGLNYRFKDLGMTTEVVTYIGEHCKSAANFLYIVDPRERVKVEYTGGKPFSLVLSTAELKTFREAYELARVVSEITALRKSKERAEKKIRLIDDKISK